VWGTTPLHGLLWCQTHSVGIDFGVGVVIDHSGSTFSLRNTSKGRNTQLGHVSEQGVWQDNEHAFLSSHIPHLLFAKELGEGMGRWVVASLECTVLLLPSPRFGAKKDRYPAVSGIPG